MEELVKTSEEALLALGFDLQQQQAAASEDSNNDVGQPSVSQPGAKAQPAVSGVEAKKAPRKRGPSAAQLCKEASLRLEDALSLVQRLSQENVTLRARADMYEAVLEIKDLQLKRLAEIQSGTLNFNPFEAVGTSADNIMQARPDTVHGMFGQVVGGVAARVATVLPLLEQHPLLFFCPASSEEDGSGVLPQLRGAAAAAAQVLSSLKPTSQFEATQIAELRSLTTKMVDMRVCFQYGLFMNPDMVLMASNHRTLTDGTLTWEQLARKVVTHLDGSSTAGVSDDGTPLLATEEHWRAVAAKLRLTDQQRLYAHALHQIVNKARQGIASQRAAISKTMAHVFTPRSGGGAAPVAGDTGTSSGGGAAPTAPYICASLVKTPEQVHDEVLYMKRLQTTLARERFLMVLAAEVVFSKLFSPVQCACYISFALPFMPDEVAILHAAAAECTPEVLARLAAATAPASG